MTAEQQLQQSEGVTERKPWKNEMNMEFDAVSLNESFARVAVAAFVAHLNPTLEELADIKTAVSEAVTNAIIHGYDNVYGYGKHGNSQPAYLIIHPGKVQLRCSLEKDVLRIEVEDHGKGIQNVEQAMEPLFTTKPEYDRSGMGFAFMEAFMDELEVHSEPGHGTLVRMVKKLGTYPLIEEDEEAAVYRTVPGEFTDAETAGNCSAGIGAGRGTAGL